MTRRNDDATKETRAQRAIIKALRALNEAADALGTMDAYYNKNNFFHNSTVKKYNSLLTAAQILGEAQRI